MQKLWKFISIDLHGRQGIETPCFFVQISIALETRKGRPRSVVCLHRQAWACCTYINGKWSIQQHHWCNQAAERNAAAWRWSESMRAPVGYGQGLQRWTAQPLLRKNPDAITASRNKLITTRNRFWDRTSPEEKSTGGFCRNRSPEEYSLAPSQGGGGIIY